MEGPGMSLFQGAASIHINNSAQDRLEEQEELEDQKRRNKELKDKLANAFDDLLDDDEASSVNSSGNFTLNTGHTNGGHREERGNSRTGLPPTYVESLHHLKEQNTPESPKLYCETPKAKHAAHITEDEGYKMQFSPYGAGDGQNNYYHQDSRGHVNGANNYEVRQDYVNNENLKVLYEMRMKECQELASRMEKLDQEVDSLRARLTATVNDRDKAELSLQEAHHLLASSKHSLIELEQRVTTLTDRLKESEQEKEQLKLELRSANISLQNVQQRLHTMQVAHTHDTDALFREQQDRHREEMDRMQNDLTKAKNRLDEKENEIKTLEKRCMEKDREKEEILIEKGGTINRLASELEAAQSRLLGGEAARLKERAAQLAAERNAAREQVKELGSKLEITAHELVLCRNKLLANQKEYEHWQNTLHQILMETMPDKGFIGDPPSPGKLATLKEILSRYKLQVQKLTTMQDEISKRDKKLEQHRRQESELRARLDEQRGVETQLTSRVAVLQSKLDLLAAPDSDLLDAYKQQGEQLQHELDQLRAEYKNMDLKYTELEMEHDKLKAEKGSRASLAQAANADLLRELDRCGARLKDTLKENGDLKNLYLQACSSRDAATRELKDLHSKLSKEKELYKNQEQEYIGRIEKEKQQAEKLSSDLANCREELERANKRISELQKEFTDKQKEFTEKLNAFLEDEKSALRKDMEPCEQCEKHLKRIRQLDEQLSKCSIKLANQESNEALMQELRGKAEFFQQYIAERFRRLRDLRSVAVNTDPAPAQPPPAAPAPAPAPAQPPHHPPPSPPPPPSPDEQQARDCDDAIAAKTALMMKEKAIRDQIAEKFTLEIKTLEMNSARRLKEMEDEHLATAKKLKELLERKAQEIETLKQFILSERSKVTQILESKENEISVLIKEHNELQAECHRAKDEVVEWRLKAERYKERVARLAALEGGLRRERDEGRARGAAAAAEAEAARAQAADAQARVQQLEQRAQQLRADHQLLLDKYKAVKRTVAVYKGYINKRDAHVTNEMNRIQDDYKKIFLKMQNQLNYHVNRRVQEDRSKGKHTQAQQYQNYNYVEKIAKLEEDLARLAQSPFNAELENP